jgi:hypothetical protein
LPAGEPRPVYCRVPWHGRRKANAQAGPCCRRRHRVPPCSRAMAASSDSPPSHRPAAAHRAAEYPAAPAVS